MMGSRGWKGGGECDALSHRYRRRVRFNRGYVKYFKRKFWKRMRRLARLDLRTYH